MCVSFYGYQINRLIPTQTLREIDHYIMYDTEGRYKTQSHTVFGKQKTLDQIYNRKGQHAQYFSTWRRFRPNMEELIHCKHWRHNYRTDQNSEARLNNFNRKKAKTGTLQESRRTPGINSVHT